ncbi:MAG: VWA domain-containing protein [Thermoguttaceae bacterium]|nr:VWA domain-containing protein [Thermoguttaceae bacterium]MBR4752879.1 VWA domain-containing protein [Thermoguttaceae bacterium]MBR5758347.1 VWA domain-containing protein [Thermoguttaceae bacterium]
MSDNQGMGGYFVDIVMCIDATGSMSPIIDEVKRNAVSFYQQFVDSMEENQKDVDQLRIKVIAFRDYGCDDEPMVESPFYTLPDDVDAFASFVDSIEAMGGGDGPENALEAIALALKSDWTTGGSKRRHAILVFSDAPALPLREREGTADYPDDMPENLAQLGAWWHGTDQTLASTYQPKAGRLVAFVPDAEPWSGIQEWNRYWPIFSKAGTGLDDVDLQEVIALMVGSF